MTRWFAWSLLAVLLALMTLSGAVVFTESGLQWLARELPRWVPGRLSIGEVRGRLCGPFELDELRYEYDDVLVVVEHIELDWSPEQLLREVLRVDVLAARGIRVRATGGGGEPSGGPPAVVLPIAVELPSARLADITLELNSAEPLELERIDIAARARKSQLKVAALEIRGTSWRVSASGELEARRHYPLDVELAWEASLGPTMDGAGEGKLSGDLNTLQISHRSEAPLVSEFAGSVSSIMEAMSWQGHLYTTPVQLSTLHDDLPTWTVGADLDLSGTLDAIRAVGAVQAELPEVGPLSSQVDVAYEASTIDVARLEVQSAVGRAQATGKVDISDELPRATIQAQWQDMHWPAGEGEAKFTSSRGQMELNGTLERYGLVSGFDLTVSGYPAGQWSVRGNGSQDGLAVDSMHAALGPGRLQGSGRLDWSDVFRFQVDAEAQDVDPATWLPQWPGKLAIALSSEGHYSGGALSVATNLKQVEGSLRGQRVSVAGMLSVSGDDLSVPHLSVNYGSNSVILSGDLRESWDLELDASLPRIDEFLADSAGAATLHAKLSGPRATPTVVAQASAEDVIWDEWRCGNAELDVDWDGAGKRAGQARLHLSDAGYRGLEAQSGLLDISGTTDEHKIRMAVEVDDVTWVTALDGALVTDQWQGWLRASTLDAKTIGTWVLRESVALNVAVDRVDLDMACWSDGTGHVCVEATVSGSQPSRLHVNSERLAIALLEPLLEADFDLSGYVSADASLRWQPNGPLLADVTAKGDSIAFTERYAGTTGQALGLRLPDVVAELHLTEQRLTSRLYADLTGEDFVSGALDIPRRAGADVIAVDGASGQLKVSITDLSALTLLIPALDSPRGRLAGDLKFAGSMEQPRVSGQIALSEGEVSLPDLGIKLRNVVLTAHGQNTDRLLLTGRAASGGGEVQLEGQTRVRFTEAWSAELVLRGDNFEVINTPAVWARVSPNISLRRSERRLDIDGEVLVPSARVTPQVGAAQAQLSDDVQIVGAEEERAPTERLRVYSTVRIVLGENVQLRGFGLTGRIRGSVLASDEPGRLTTGRGELEIVDGRYTALGAPLAVDPGRLLFTGGPVDDPGLDARATREVDTITVGVTVRGRLREPEVTVFSDPEMSQIEALSYLLYGRSAQQASESQAAVLLRTASALRAMKGGSDPFRDLADRMGFSEAYIEGGDGDAGASVVVGRYLSPRLYASYALGLFEPTSTLRLSYKLTERWTAQTETSTSQQGGDLLYVIER